MLKRLKRLSLVVCLSLQISCATVSTQHKYAKVDLAPAQKIYDRCKVEVGAVIVRGREVSFSGYDPVENYKDELIEQISRSLSKRQNCKSIEFQQVIGHTYRGDFDDDEIKSRFEPEDYNSSLLYISFFKIRRNVSADIPMWYLPWGLLSLATLGMLPVGAASGEHYLVRIKRPNNPTLEIYEIDNGNWTWASSLFNFIKNSDKTNAEREESAKKVLKDTVSAGVNFI
ncbi:hypothetical protein [Bdellovibrio sp. BCCA]|uniref:hypothetical protein n=1 Tax=Bdellovibrio sp. BCCA TaxID=3136281 RepID=UPI0030EFD6B9